MLKNLKYTCLTVLILMVFSTSIVNAASNLMYIYNKIGLDLMKEEKYEDAIDNFEKSLKVSPKYEDNFLKNPKKTYEEDDDLWDSPLNNLSWAYYEMGDYEKGVKYIEEALRILPNDAIEYYNGAKSYLELGQVDIALDYYKKSMEIADEYYAIYYGIGRCYFEKGEYKNALKAFNEYLKHDKDNLNVQLFKVYCYLYDNKENEAIRHMNNMIKNNPEDYTVYYEKAKVLRTIGNYEDIKEFYDKYIKKFSEKGNLEYEMGIVAYNSGEYEDSLSYFTKAVELNKENEYYRIWLGYTYKELNQLDKAYNKGNEVINLNPKSFGAYTLLGDVEIRKQDYTKAIEYFDKSIEIESNFQSAYEGKLAALYLSKRYEKVIEYGLEYEKRFNNNYGISWSMGDSYFQLSKYQEAIEEYKKIYEIDPKNNIVVSSLGMCYFYLEDFNNAKAFAKEALGINPTDQNGLFINEYLEDMDKPLVDLLDKLFKQDYLYYGELKEYNREIKKYLNKKNLTIEEADELLNNLKKEGDIFTYSVYGEYYDKLQEMKEESKIFTIIEDDKVYIKINNFYLHTDEQFMNFIDSIENTENKKLIIDLRYNSGGNTNSANSILDMLLPEGVVSTTIDKNNKKYEYVSDPEQVKFEKIYIFVDKDTASAAELLTLGLKDKLENVTVIGEKTFGKGVGQFMYDHKEKNILLAIVNHKWYVGDKNVLGVGIEPDIKVSGPTKEDYFKHVN